MAAMGKQYSQQEVHEALTILGLVDQIQQTGVVTRADAHQAFRELAREAHPDVGGSEEAFRRLNWAWGLIQDTKGVRLGPMPGVQQQVRVVRVHMGCFSIWSDPYDSTTTSATNDTFTGFSFTFSA